MLPVLAPATLSLELCLSKAFTERFLAHPDFYLQTDASNLGLGFELFQIDASSERKTIGFASRSLNLAEENNTVTEL